MSHHADLALARRIEHLGTSSQRAIVATYRERYPQFDASVLEVAGGLAAFCEPESPVNGAVGLGLSGAVTAADIVAVEAFYRERGERPLIAVAPLADPTLTALLGEAGWVPSAYENVLVREIDPAEEFAPAASDIEIRIATSPEDRDLWAALVGNGFSAPDDPTETELRTGLAAAHTPGVVLMLAFVDGEPAGTGELQVADRIGWLTADTTLPQFRRRGVQGALQRARLAYARDAGATLALTETMPGTASQRNMERLGFRIVYTRIEALAPLAPTEGTSD
ncbi:MAG: N-acetyltransferase [Coriobacteriia bacterium]|nr:N-acetyltransferase [Coriobacteriia bacterium]